MAIMKYLLYLMLTLTLFNCSSSTESISECEVVINAQGPGFLKVINKLNIKIEVFLPEYAFGAIVNSNKCEIYGLNTGLRKATISVCTDNDCDTISESKTIQFNIEDGKTHTVEVKTDFFKKP